MFANIIPNAKISISGGILTYKIPPSLVGKIILGQLVQIRLGNRPTTGIVIEILKKPAFDFDYKKIKPIDKIIDPVPVIDESRLALARFIADYYFTSLPLTIFSMLPPLLRKPRVREL